MPNKFTVTRFADGGSVTVDDEVEADYVLYPNGMLVFKKERPGSYPEIVKIYAAEQWKRVTVL